MPTVATKKITLTYTISIPGRGVDAALFRNCIVETATAAIKKAAPNIGAVLESATFSPDNFNSGGGIGGSGSGITAG